MADHAYTDQLGYPLKSGEVLRHRRNRTPLQTGATQRAAFGALPATVHQLADEVDEEKREARE